MDDATKKLRGRIRIDVRKCVNKIAKRREQVRVAAVTTYRCSDVTAVVTCAAVGVAGGPRLEGDD